MGNKVTLQPNVLNLAKQGDPNAIAQLISTSLRGRGITSQIEYRNGRLEIFLQADPAPDQSAMMDFMHRGFANLNPLSIVAVKVYGCHINSFQPVWQQELQLQRLTKDHEIAAWVNQGKLSPETSGIAHDFSEATNSYPSHSVTETRFLRFQLGLDNFALICLADIKEVLKIPVEAIVSVPDMPDFVVGIYNCRGEMLWLVDLNAQLGFQVAKLNTYDIPQTRQDSTAFSQAESHSSAQSALTAIAIQSDDKSLGIIVPQLFDIEIHDTQEMQPSSAQLFSQELLPFIQGYFPRAGVPVFNAKVLFQNSQFQVHAVY